MLRDSTATAARTTVTLCSATGAEHAGQEQCGCHADDSRVLASIPWLLRQNRFSSQCLVEGHSCATHTGALHLLPQQVNSLVRSGPQVGKVGRTCESGSWIECQGCRGWRAICHLSVVGMPSGDDKMRGRVSIVISLKFHFHKIRRSTVQGCRIDSSNPEQKMQKRVHCCRA